MKRGFMHGPTIHTFSIEAIGIDLAGIGLNLGTSNAQPWPVANQALFVPFNVCTPIVVNALFWGNGNVVSGNVDAGIYDIKLNRIVSTSPTPQAGANYPQIISITPLALTPGKYYLALAIDNVTSTIMAGFTWMNGGAAFAGMAELAAGFPLPAVAACTQITGTYVPSFGCIIAPRTTL